jgi:gas vesicle protein
MEDQDEFVAGQNGGAPGRRVAGGFVAGVVLGAVIGAGVALLFAPQKGTKTRRRLRRQMERFGGEALERLDEVAEPARAELVKRRRRIRSRLGRAADRTRDAISDAL